MDSKMLSIVVTLAVTITVILTVIGCCKAVQIPREDQPVLGEPVNGPILNVDDLVGKTPEEVEDYLGEPIGEPLIFEPGEDIYYSAKTSLYMYGYRTDRLSPLIVRYDFDTQKLLSLTVYFKTEVGLPEEDEALDLLNIDPGFSPTVITDSPISRSVRCDEGNVFMYDVDYESPDDKTSVSLINFFFIME